MSFGSEEMERARRVVEQQKAKEHDDGRGQAAASDRDADAGGGSVLIPGGTVLNPGAAYTLSRPAAGAGSGSGLSVGMGVAPYYPTFTFDMPAKEEEPLPVVRQEEAVRGWRLARLGLTPDKASVRLRALHYDVNLLPEARSECMGNRANWSFATLFSTPEKCSDSPAAACSCGFYALEDRRQLSTQAICTMPTDHPFTVELEVDLSGRVIEGQRGLRAQHQRILTCWLPGACGGGFMCEEAPVVVVLKPNKSYVACEKHAEGAKRTATLAQLSNRLGVEVRRS